MLSLITPTRALFTTTYLNFVKQFINYEVDYPFHSSKFCLSNLEGTNC